MRKEIGQNITIFKCCPWLMASSSPAMFVVIQSWGWRYFVEKKIKNNSKTFNFSAISRVHLNCSSVTSDMLRKRKRKKNKSNTLAFLESVVLVQDYQIPYTLHHSMNIKMKISSLSPFLCDLHWFLLLRIRLSRLSF